MFRRDEADVEVGRGPSGAERDQGEKKYHRQPMGVQVPVQERGPDPEVQGADKSGGVIGIHVDKEFITK
jgi:hypothetical protein